MKKPCKECPHFIRNRHNDIIVDFAERTGKKQIDMRKYIITAELRKLEWQVNKGEISYSRMIEYYVKKLMSMQNFIIKIN